jgi:hypothetical protein
MIIAFAALADAPVQEGQQGLLNAFTTYIATDIVRAANLVDFVDEDFLGSGSMRAEHQQPTIIPVHFA